MSTTTPGIYRTTDPWFGQPLAVTGPTRRDPNQFHTLCGRAEGEELRFSSWLVEEGSGSKLGGDDADGDVRDGGTRPPRGRLTPCGPWCAGLWGPGHTDPFSVGLGPPCQSSVRHLRHPP